MRMQRLSDRPLDLARCLLDLVRCLSFLRRLLTSPPDLSGDGWDLCPADMVKKGEERYMSRGRFGLTS